MGDGRGRGRKNELLGWLVDWLIDWLVDLQKSFKDLHLIFVLQCRIKGKTLQVKLGYPTLHVLKI